MQKEMWNITKNDVQAMVTRGFRLEYIWERSNVKETEETEEGRRQTVIGDNEAGAQRPSNLNYSYPMGGENCWSLWSYQTPLPRSSSIGMQRLSPLQSRQSQG